MTFFAVVLVSLLSCVGAQTIGFISPKYQDTTLGGRYGSDSQWPLGSSQVVAFSCPWKSYRLELWQQKIGDEVGAAVSSNFVYNQSAGQQLPQAFYWTVQTYELQLSASPVFFWWLFDNINTTSQGQPSAYFNISIDNTPSASTSSSGGPTTTSSSTFSAPSATITVSSSDSSAPNSTSTSIDIASNTPTAAAGSRGLSVAGAVGIGVDLSLASILILAVAILLFLRWKRKQKQQPQQQHQQWQPISISTSQALVSASEHYATKPVEVPLYQDPRPIELRELQGDPRLECINH
ncbi:hypothetical protein F5B18DRAFT_671399 [Nemania serpens]|nr:hypothetical protein F5B18DRAFT_671399 [Nemania serpens]